MKLGSIHTAPGIRTRMKRLAQLKWPSIVVLGLVALLVSCVSVNRVMMAPPDIPGAEYVGSDTCAQCHEEISQHFGTATHARLMAPGPNAINAGCESCHGPGSLHSESGGEARTIINPGSSPDTCFRCHLDKRAEFRLPSHHPVLEGHLGCSDCHDAHKGPAVRGGGTALLAENETCAQCHSAQHNTFVFEHEATREGCTICHKPHGSVNARMLTEHNATLCLKCHFQQQTAPGRISIGGRDHSAFLSRGTCWTAGCHEAVHGSQVTSSLRF